MLKIALCIVCVMADQAIECWTENKNYLGDFTLSSFGSNCVTWKGVTNEKYQWENLSRSFGDRSDGNHKFCRTNGTVQPWCLNMWGSVAVCTELKNCNDRDGTDTIETNSWMSNSMDSNTRNSNVGLQSNTRQNNAQFQSNIRRNNVELPSNTRRNNAQLQPNSRQIDMELPSNSLQPNLENRPIRHQNYEQQKQPHNEQNRLSNDTTASERGLPVRPDGKTNPEIEMLAKPENGKLVCTDIDFLDAVYYKGRLFGAQNRFITYCMESLDVKPSNVVIGVVAIYVWNAIVLFIIICGMFKFYNKIRFYQQQRRQKPQFNNWETMNH